MPMVLKADYQQPYLVQLLMSTTAAAAAAQLGVMLCMQLTLHKI